MQAEIRKKMPESDSSNDDDLIVALYRISPVQQAAASCAGAVITSLFVTPLDVIKTRLQAQQKAGKLRFTGTFDAFFGIARKEGAVALWSGLAPTLVLALPATILYFVTYEQLRLKFRDYYNSKIGNKNVQHLRQPFWIPMLSGASARVIAVSCVSPLELVKTKMQSERLSYFEMRRAMKMLVETSGVQGLWKGITPTLCRDVPFSAIYWSSYESIKRVFDQEIATFPLSFVAGAASGGIAATITTPFDVVKTHQQIAFGTSNVYGQDSRRNSMREIMIHILARHGIKGLYAGLLPRLMKVTPACAIMISSFEYSKVFFARRSRNLATNEIYYDFRYETVLDFSLDEIPVVVVVDARSSDETREE